MLLLYLTVLTTRLLLPPNRPVQGDCAADVCQSSEPKICIGFPLGKATRGLINGSRAWFSSGTPKIFLPQNRCAFVLELRVLWDVICVAWNLRSLIFID